MRRPESRRQRLREMNGATRVHGAVEIGLPARGEGPAAVDRRCIPGLTALDHFIQGSNTAGIRPRLVLHWPGAALVTAGAAREARRPNDRTRVSYLPRFLPACVSRGTTVGSPACPPQQRVARDWRKAASGSTTLILTTTCSYFILLKVLYVDCSKCMVAALKLL